VPATTRRCAAQSAHVVVRLAGEQHIAHLAAQVRGQIHRRIGDGFVLALHAAQLVRQRRIARLQRRIGKLRRIHRPGEALRREHPDGEGAEQPEEHCGG